MEKIRSLIVKLDWFLLILIMVTCVFGIVMVSTASSNYETSFRYVQVQVVSFLVGLCVLFCTLTIDYERIASFSVVMFVVSVLMLLAVFVPGLDNGLKSEMGSSRWIRFGGFGFQPSEIIKTMFIVTFSYHLSCVDEDISKLKNLILVCIHAFIIVGLVMIEPDAGAALTFFVIAIAMMFMTGLHWKYFAFAFACFTAFVPIVWFWILEDYQKLRIYNFINPEADPLKSGYQVMQSKMVVGAGEIIGKGLYHGTSQLGFLPERHNDFIFSVIGEETGLLGCIFTMTLLILIILRCIHIARNAKNSLGMYIVVGVAAMLTFQTFENIGMCIGLMPVTGITLPFISYGGSSLITNLATIGLVLNVHYRCRIINF